MIFYVRAISFAQVLLTALVTPVMISLAHVLAYPALIVPQLRQSNDTLHLDQDEGSWYTSIYSLWSPVGSLIAGIPSHFEKMSNNLFSEGYIKCFCSIN